MTIFVTKWVLGNGVIVRYDDAEAVTVRGRKGDRHCAIVRAKKGSARLKFWPREWHPTEAAARTRAEEMRQAMLEALARQAERMDSLKFSLAACVVTALIGCSSPAPECPLPSCDTYCADQIAACGSLEQPLPGNPRDDTGNPVYQHRDPQWCRMDCARFDEASLACRAIHVRLVLEGADLTVQCPLTGDFGACAPRSSP